MNKLYELCKAENSEDLVARVYPQINKLFQRSVASLSQSRTSIGLLLLVRFIFSIVFNFFTQPCVVTVSFCLISEKILGNETHKKKKKLINVK